MTKIGIILEFDKKNIFNANFLKMFLHSVEMFLILSA